MGRKVGTMVGRWVEWRRGLVIGISGETRGTCRSVDKGTKRLDIRRVCRWVDSREVDRLMGRCIAWKTRGG